VVAAAKDVGNGKPLQARPAPWAFCEQMQHVLLGR
jgi:hypothetical protein